MTDEQKQLIIEWSQCGVISEDEARSLLHRPWWRRALDWLAV